jgi:hypothetical protein
MLGDMTFDPNDEGNIGKASGLNISNLTKKVILLITKKQLELTQHVIYHFCVCTD